MDREYINARQIYKRHVEDDGWSENMPMEIIDVIDLNIQNARNIAKNEVEEQHKRHKGKWLTEEIARNYADRALPYWAFYNGQYIRRVRDLGEELQKIYGVTELEAMNILRNCNIDDYVNKYRRIRKKIPLKVNEEVIFNDMISTMYYAM